jgi:hypothetical protein
LVNETFILVSMVVLGLIVVMAITVVWVAIWTNRKLRADPDFAVLQEKRPEGYWMGIGVALGVALGLPLGLAINAAMGDAGSGTAIGPAMGVAIGVAIGAALEQRHKGETRPLTSYEKRARRWTTWVGIAVLVLLAAVGVIGAMAWLLQ